MASQSVDRVALLEQARRLAQHDNLAPAIEAYERLVELDPADWNSHNVLGDLLVRAHLVDQAIVEYIKVARHLAESGFVARSRGMYRKILRLQPDHADALRGVEEAKEQQRHEKSPGDTGLFKRVLQAAHAEAPPAGEGASLGEDQIAESPQLRIARQSYDDRTGGDAGDAATGPADGDDSAKAGGRASLLAALQAWGGEVETSAAPAPQSPTGSTMEAPGPHEALDTPAPMPEDGATPATGAESISDIESELDRFMGTQEAVREASLPQVRPGDAVPTLTEVQWEGAGPGAGPADVFDSWRTHWMDAVATHAEMLFEQACDLTEAGHASAAVPYLQETLLTPHLRHDSARRLAQAFLALQKPEAAVECLEWAARAPAPSQEVSWGLTYDVAMALEAAGQPELAAAVLVELQRDAGEDYRDVPTRLAALTGR